MQNAVSRLSYKPILFALAALPLLLSPLLPVIAGPNANFTVTDKQVGPIGANTTSADLRRLFGASHVVDKQLTGAEGEMSDGSVVNPGSPDELDIYWTDKTRTHPAEIRIFAPGSRYRTAVGNVGVGTTVADLVKKNGGKPIHFSGFDWDYGGTISDWGGGPLGKAFGGKSHIRLQLGHAVGADAKMSDAETKSVEGEQQVSSSNPALRKLRPYVREITVGF